MSRLSNNIKTPLQDIPHITPKVSSPGLISETTPKGGQRGQEEGGEPPPSL